MYCRDSTLSLGLTQMRSMLTFLEAARYKVGGTLAEVEGGKRGKHPLAEHILVSRDKQGLQQSVLKVRFLNIKLILDLIKFIYSY